MLQRGQIKDFSDAEVDSTARPNSIELASTARVSENFLTWLYMLIPLGLLLLSADHWLFSSFFKTHLPADPEENVYFTILFVSPHILWSLISASEKNYLKHLISAVRWHYWLFNLVLPLTLLTFFGKPYFLVCQAFISLRHVFFQQFGVSRMLLRSKPSSHAGLTTALEYLIVLSAIVFFFQYLFLDDDHTFWVAKLIDRLLVNSKFFVTTSILLTVAVMFLNIRNIISARLIPRLNYLGSLALAPFFAVCFSLGYTFIGILVLRLVHDLTAMSFYYVHDVNRNQEGRKNFFYSFRLLRWLPIPILAPLLAIALAHAVIGLSDFYWIGLLSILLELLHRLIEGVCWKKGSPMASSILLSK